MENVYVKAQKALNKIRDNKVDQGLNEMIEICNEYPGDSELAHALAQAYGVLNRVIDSIQEYQRAIKLNNNIYQYHFNLGNAYHKMKLHDLAIESFTTAAMLNFSDSDILSHRGTEFLHLYKHERAFIDFKNALKINPNDKLALNGLKIISSIEQSIRKKNI
jgi:tetratricopeptide (TPR) repeat protein